jgi:hypothetical protein
MNCSENPPAARSLPRARYPGGQIPKNKLLRYDPREGVVLCKAWHGACTFSIDTGVGIKLSQIALGAAKEKTCLLRVKLPSRSTHEAADWFRRWERSSNDGEGRRRSRVTTMGIPAYGRWCGGCRRLTRRCERGNGQPTRRWRGTSRSIPGRFAATLSSCGTSITLRLRSTALEGAITTRSRRIACRCFR